MAAECTLCKARARCGFSFWARAWLGAVARVVAADGLGVEGGGAGEDGGVELCGDLCEERAREDGGGMSQEKEWEERTRPCARV